MRYQVVFFLKNESLVEEKFIGNILADYVDVSDSGVLLFYRLNKIAGELVTAFSNWEYFNEVPIAEPAAIATDSQCQTEKL
jgi:hypothetical protein